MSEDFRTNEAGSADAGKAPRKTTREDRLAEELRANLKRRKAAARRQKKPVPDEDKA